ncbi:MAG TPA: DNA-formamidopyrimidine glycosylase family protein [Actinomycetota bacterium]|nr:DNA-formamidopyrimidine glycosylase family protein [Actinomycetota bacterium]
MPEGDTVFRSARSMNKAFAGRVLVETDFRVPQHAAADLSGQTVTAVVPRGKHMLTRTDAGITLHTHFKMEGTWHLYRPETRWRGGPAYEIRAILRNEQWTAVGYRLAIVELVATADEDKVVGHLGPDLLGPDWDLDEALRRITARPERAIGDALLDQTNLAGIGNIYKNETLFLKGLHPWTPVEDVKDLAGVVLMAQRLLRTNVEQPMQTTTGSTRPGEERWVFSRGGKQCRRCGGRIATGTQGDPGVERFTYWCPNCQPEPVRTGQT